MRNEKAVVRIRVACSLKNNLQLGQRCESLGAEHVETEQAISQIVQVLQTLKKQN